MSPSGACTRCGHSRRGIPENRPCPECGASTPSRKRSLLPTQPADLPTRELWRFALSLGLAAIAPAAGALLGWSGVLDSFLTPAIAWSAKAMALVLPLVAHVLLTRPIPLGAREETVLGEPSAFRRLARWGGLLWLLPSTLALALAFVPASAKEHRWIEVAFATATPLTAQASVLLLGPVVRGLATWMAADRESTLAQWATLAAVLGAVGSLAPLAGLGLATSSWRDGCITLGPLVTVVAPMLLLTSIAFMAANSPSLLMLHYQRQDIKSRLEGQDSD